MDVPPLRRRVLESPLSGAPVGSRTIARAAIAGAVVRVSFALLLRCDNVFHLPWLAGTPI
ncbi:MAG: hypothetical protein J2P53_18160 [Bradyrhizobiaceae bacterium]|nr:hypothetical protein [Bradyrhizobiaceae bacterium]